MFSFRTNLIFDNVSFIENSAGEAVKKHMMFIYAYIYSFSHMYLSIFTFIDIIKQLYDI
jgi:hypothetical protein